MADSKWLIEREERWMFRRYFLRSKKYLLNRKNLLKSLITYLTAKLIVLVYSSRTVLLDNNKKKKAIFMLHIRPVTPLAQAFKKLLDIGPDHKMCFETLSTPIPKSLGNTKLFEPSRPVETGHDVFNCLIRDRTHYRVNTKDSIQNCIGPIHMFELLEPIYELGLVDGIEIAFFSHTLINIHTNELLVPVIDKKQAVALVPLSNKWPAYRKVIVLKTD